MSGGKAPKADFRVTALILRDGEEVVARHVETDVLKPAVEAVAECISESKC